MEHGGIHKQGKNTHSFQIRHISERKWGLRNCAKAFLEEVDFEERYEGCGRASTSQVFWRATLKYKQQQGGKRLELFEFVEDL